MLIFCTKGASLKLQMLYILFWAETFMVGLPETDHNGSWLKVVLLGFCDMNLKDSFTDSKSSFPSKKKIRINSRNPY